jgi:DNA adenine methylase
MAHIAAARRPERTRRARPERSRGALQPDLAAPAVPVSARVRPPLKWAGGKRWQLPHLQPIWQAHAGRRLVEPFCGALAVTLGLLPRQALLNDVNPHVVNFYRWLQRGLVATIEMANRSKVYYAHRQRFNALLAVGQGDTPEAASLFYYLNRTGYNGLCRFNRDGAFNVPFGRYNKVEYRKDFTAYQDLFSRFEFANDDFETIPLLRDDFVYADPPYDVEFRQYSRAGFGWDEQVRTAEWLARHPGPVVLSNQATERIVSLYTRLGYQLMFVTGPRHISCTGDRTPAREVLATRNV